MNKLGDKEQIELRKMREKAFQIKKRKKRIEISFLDYLLSLADECEGIGDGNLTENVIFKELVRRVWQLFNFAVLRTVQFNSDFKKVNFMLSLYYSELL